MTRKETVTVTVTDAAGSAAGSAKTAQPISGRVLAVHLDYTTQPATADVTLATQGAPTLTVLTVSNANTDAWFFPRQLMDGTNGADLTGIYEPLPVDDHLVVSVAQGDPGSVVATILWTDEL